MFGFVLSGLCCVDCLFELVDVLEGKYCVVDVIIGGMVGVYVD